MESVFDHCQETPNFRRWFFNVAEKVYLYRNDVKAEYSAQPTQNKQLQEQRRNKRQEEVFRYPTDWSSSETSGSDVSVTHRITVPPNGNIQIESIVKSDDDKSVRHNAVSIHTFNCFLYNLGGNINCYYWLSVLLGSLRNTAL